MAKHLFTLVYPCVGNVLREIHIGSTLGSSLSRFAEIQSCYQLEKSNREKCKSQTNSVCSQPRYRSAPSPGPSQISNIGVNFETKYRRRDYDDQILVSYIGSNIEGEKMIIKYWRHVLVKLVGSNIEPNIGGWMMMTKYWCHTLDQILGGEMMIIKYWRHVSRRNIGIVHEFELSWIKYRSRSR